jgi:hypothetical protein
MMKRSDRFDESAGEAFSSHNVISTDHSIRTAVYEAPYPHKSSLGNLEPQPRLWFSSYYLSICRLDTLTTEYLSATDLVHVSTHTDLLLLGISHYTKPIYHSCGFLVALTISTIHIDRVLMTPRDAHSSHQFQACDRLLTRHMTLYCWLDLMLIFTRSSATPHPQASAKFFSTLDCFSSVMGPFSANLNAAHIAI